jgi:hypothetical protein
VIGNAYVEGLGAFSKVTKLVRDVWTHAPAEAQQKPSRPPPPERPPPPTSENFDSLQSLENGFEYLLPDIQVRMAYSIKTFPNLLPLNENHNELHCPTRFQVNRDFQNNKKTMEHSDHWIVTGWHGKQWDFQNNEKTMEHSDHWIVTGWHGEQCDFQNNEKTMEHSDHWIVTGWHGEQMGFSRF